MSIDKSLSTPWSAVTRAHPDVAIHNETTRVFNYAPQTIAVQIRATHANTPMIAQANISFAQARELIALLTAALEA